MLKAIGSRYFNKTIRIFGDIGCFSAHPLKNLNAIGDSGFITTNNKMIYEKIVELRSHGMVKRDRINNFGYVSRMDNLHASVLNFRLDNLKKIIVKRRKNFENYQEYLKRNFVFFPDEENHQYNSYHTFVIQVKNRDKLKKYLKLKILKLLFIIQYQFTFNLQQDVLDINEIIL